VNLCANVVPLLASKPFSELEAPAFHTFAPRESYYTLHNCNIHSECILDATLSEVNGPSTNSTNIGREQSATASLQHYRRPLIRVWDICVFQCVH
jgi:hypothetical protein